MSSDDTVPSVRYLDPVYDELAQLRTDNARLTRHLSFCRSLKNAEYKQLHAALDQAEERIDQLTDTLALRSDALNRTGAQNDALRAQLATLGVTP
jgi:septal ring factor EnvC (AmiA/AmiB activator)